MILGGETTFRDLVGLNPCRFTFAEQQLDDLGRGDHLSGFGGAKSLSVHFCGAKVIGSYGQT
jgi:hypothetical protein